MNDARERSRRPMLRGLAENIVVGFLCRWLPARSSSLSLRPLVRAGAIVAFVSFARSASAQQSFNVGVRVISDGSPVSGALVASETVERLTGDDGLTTLLLLPGNHTLRVTRLGYADAERRLLVQSDTAVEIELEAEALEDDAIVVLSTRGERRIEEEPVRVEVLVQEEIEEKLLMTPGSIAMLLNETTGLRVQETSPSLGGAGIRIQGLRGRYTQLLADGLPLYGGQAGALGLLQIPPMDLRQVEVIKGAASALYGSSALGGVINLISRRPANEREVLFNATTRGGTDALVWWAGERERWGYTVLGGLHGQPRTDVDGDHWQDIPMHRRATVRPRVFWNGTRGRGMLTFGAMVEDREGGGVLPGGQPYVQEIETARLDGGISGSVLIGPALLLDYRTSLVTTSHDHQFDARRERDRHSTLFGEMSLRGEAGDHGWTAGFALQRDAYSARDVDDFDYGYWSPGVFVQDEWTAAEGVSLSASARLDRHSRYGSFLSPRASVLFRPTGNLSVRMSAGTGFFAPTPFTEETEEIGLANVEPLGDLEAERARSAAIDLGLGLGGFEANMTVFASRIEHAIAVQPGADGAKATLINLDGTTRTHGTELLFRYRREPWGVTASHTWVDATEPAAGATRPVPLTPTHLGGLVAVYEKHGEGRIGLEVYFTGKQHVDDNPYRTRTAAYVIAGVLMERRFGIMRVFLNLENITDRRQTRYDPILLPAPGPFGRRTTDSWAPLEGRVFNGGIRLSF